MSNNYKEFLDNALETSNMLTLTKLEEKHVKTFLQKHGIELKDIMFKFTPTGIGMHVEVIYEYKKFFITRRITEDITDYGSW